jgi:8-oxo-dGTP diphosphatase
MREIKEELDVFCEVGEFLMEVSKEYEHGDFKLLVYKATIKGEANIKALVHQDLKWVKAKDMGNYEFPPADVEIIEFLQNKF